MKLWVAAIVVFGSLMGYAQETQKIAETFNAYQQAVIHKDGSQAYQLVNKSTVQFYNNVWTACKMADSATVVNYPFEQKLWILTTRHVIPRAKASQLNTQQLFEQLVINGWVHKEDISDMHLGEIDLDGAYAIAQMKRNNKDIPYFFQFEKENGVWKVNLVEMLETAGRDVVEIIESTDLSEITVIIESIEKLSGKKANKTIWQPFKS